MLRHIVIKTVLVLLSMAGQETMSTEEAMLRAQTQPEYAKWGRLAMEETSKTYGDSSIVDYKYEGRKTLPGGKAEESFLLWLRKDGREFGVRVSIKLEAGTDRLEQVSLREVK